MDRAILLDEHDNESIYKFETENGTKYLFRILKQFDKTGKENCRSIEYFDHQEWNHLVNRRSTNKTYLVNLAIAMLNALPEKERK